MYAAAVVQTPPPEAHSHAELVSQYKSVKPGQRFLIGVTIHLDKDWHCYWKNPGDAGSVTSVAWKLPAGYRVGPVLYPAPHRIDQTGIISYGYEDEVTLLSEVVAPATAKVGSTVPVSADVHWLSCHTMCIAAHQKVSLKLKVATEPTLGDSSLAEVWNTLPVSGQKYVPAAMHVGSTYRFWVKAPAGVDVSGAQFFASDPEVVDHSAKESVSLMGDKLVVTLQASTYSNRIAPVLNGVVVLPEGKSWDGVHRAIWISPAVQPYRQSVSK